MNTPVSQFAAGLVAAVLVVVGYHFALPRMAPQVAVVDIQSVYAQRKDQATRAVLAARTDEERVQVVTDLARRFTDRLPSAMAELAAECRCTVLDKSVLVGVRPGTPDLTARLEQKVK